MSEMRVEGGLETVILEGTNLAVMAYFEMDVDDDGLHVHAKAHWEGSRLVCNLLEVRADRGIDRKVLSGLSLATWLQRAASIMAARVGEPTDATVVRSDVERHLKVAYKLGPRSMSDEFLELVAGAYREADRAGTPTWKAVAALNVSWFKREGIAEEATARRWIYLARDRKHLPPTTKGRKSA